jgi:hypothetical protein
VGTSPGIPSARNFYLSIVSSKCYTKVERWRLSIWNWQIQLKVKLFIWLVIEEKILTWNMLQRKGWEGPDVVRFARGIWKRPTTYSNFVLSQLQSGKS